MKREGDKAGAGAKRARKEAPTRKEKLQKQALSGELDSEETWRLLDEGLREYDEKLARQPPPPPTKAPSWMDDLDSDDDMIGTTKKPVPVVPAPTSATAVRDTAEDRLTAAWKEVARQDADRKKEQEEEKKKKEAAAKQAARLKAQEEAMERAVEAAKKLEEENAKKRMERLRKHRERAEEDMQRKREERRKAAEEELARRRKLELEERRKKKADDKEKWKEQEILEGFHGPEEAARLAAEKRSREEQEKKDIEEAKEVRKELDRLKYYSPALARKFEQENKARIEKANKVLAKKDEMVKKLQEKKRLRELRDEVHQGSKEQRTQANRRKQAQMVAEQLRLAEEAAKQAAAEGKGTEPAADEPAQLSWSVAPPSGARKLVEDVCRLRGFFLKFPTLPDCTDAQASHAGQICVVAEEAKTDGGQNVCKLKFEDGHASWWPKLCLVGEAWWEMPPGATCDCCGETCCAAATMRPRVCGSLRKVMEMYDAHHKTGVLPQWNARGVPNPRRGLCPGQECDIAEEDLQNSKVKLIFDDGFVTWFPRKTIQGATMQTQKEKAEKKAAKKAAADPHGFDGCVPATLPKHDNPAFQTGFKAKTPEEVAAAVPPTGAAASAPAAAADDAEA